MYSPQNEMFWEIFGLILKLIFIFLALRSFLSHRIFLGLLGRRSVLFFFPVGLIHQILWVGVGPWLAAVSHRTCNAGCRLFIFIAMPRN